MEWDIKILDHIRKGYEREKLFYDPGHPSGYILKYVARKIFSSLGFQGEIHGLDECMSYECDTYEIPVYAAVKNALGNRNTGDTFLRRYRGLKLTAIPMNIEQYVKEYLICFHNGLNEV